MERDSGRRAPMPAFADAPPVTTLLLLLAGVAGTAQVLDVLAWFRLATTDENIGATLSLALVSNVLAVAAFGVFLLR
jgi:hypothetical protein